MPTIVPLEAIPNQQLTIRLDDLRYTIRLNSVADSCCCATIDINGETVISGSRCVAGTLLIPYPYLEGEGGNFVFDTPDDTIPNYEGFGTTHQLLYFTNEEMRELRANL